MTGHHFLDGTVLATVTLKFLGHETSLCTGMPDSPERDNLLCPVRYGIWNMFVHIHFFPFFCEHFMSQNLKHYYLFIFIIYL